MEQSVGSGKPITIMVVEDETGIAEFIKINLERAGFGVIRAATGAQALSLLERKEPDFILLDLMLPDVDGFDLCVDLRRKHHVPLLMLTARGEDIDKIRGLESGADDYMVKPFNPNELIARIHAILRRYRVEASGDDGVYTRGALTIDPSTRRVWKHGTLLDLTPREYNLLLFLSRRAGQVFSRDAVRREVWGHEFIEERSVDVHIRRLREKIGDDASEPRYIVTVWGEGYKFNPNLPVGPQPPEKHEGR